MKLRQYMEKGNEVRITDATGQMILATVDAVNEYQRTVACRARVQASFQTGFTPGTVLKLETPTEQGITEITGRLQWVDDFLSYFSLNIVGQPRCYQRRKFFRVDNPPVEAFIGYQTAENGQFKAIQPRVKNLSGNGIALCVERDTPMQAGDRIQASIRLNDEQHIQADGEIVRTYPDIDGKDAIAAVHLSGISNRDTDVLVRYLLGLQAQRRRYQPQAA